MTEAQAYRRLGLVDPDYFAHCAELDMFKNDRLGSSGRTTQMLVQAVLTLDPGAIVHVYARAALHAERLLKQCEKYVHVLFPKNCNEIQISQAGPVVEMVREPSSRDFLGVADLAGIVKVFVDHSNFNENRSPVECLRFEPNGIVSGRVGDQVDVNIDLGWRKVGKPGRKVPIRLPYSDQVSRWRCVEGTTWTKLYSEHRISKDQD